MRQAVALSVSSCSGCVSFCTFLQLTLPWSGEKLSLPLDGFQTARFVVFTPRPWIVLLFLERTRWRSQLCRSIPHSLLAEDVFYAVGQRCQLHYNGMSFPMSVGVFPGDIIQHQQYLLCHCTFINAIPYVRAVYTVFPPYNPRHGSPSKYRRRSGRALPTP